MIIKIIAVVILLLVYKLALNITRILFVRKFQDDYLEWLNNPSAGSSLVSRVPKLKSLVKDADITEVYVPHVQHMGYGQAASFKANLLDAIPTSQVDHLSLIISILNKTLGVFQQRIFDTINPLYWITSVLFLPKSIMQYLGVNPDSVITKLLQLVWWLIAPTALIFREQTHLFIRSLFN